MGSCNPKKSYHMKTIIYVSQVAREIQLLG
jgi:hypothetical protein